MADRLTQLQDTVNMQAEHLCNSIGVLQQLAAPGKLSVTGGNVGTGSSSPPGGNLIGVGAGGQSGNILTGGLGTGNATQGGPQQMAGNPSTAQEDLAQLFASLIARAAKDIDVLIESLPSEDASPDLQVQSLRKLEAENQEAADRLEQCVRTGEVLLHQIQQALADIADSQLEMDRAFALP